MSKPAATTSLLPGVAVGIITLFAISCSSSTDDDSGETVRQPEDITCAVDDVTEVGSRVSVPLIVVEGNQETPDLSVEYRGTTVTVIFNTGDEYESQTFFSMTIEDDDGRRVNSTMYDYRPASQPGPINIVSYDNGADSLRLQCWIE